MPGIKVKLVRSRAARSPAQRETLAGLGLYKIGQVRMLPDTKPIVGMCQKLAHMIEWERVPEEPVVRPKHYTRSSRPAADPSAPERTEQP